MNSGSTSGELTVDQIPAEARHILIAVNARAGSGKRHKAVVRLADHLRQHELNCEQIESLEALSQRAEQLLKERNLRAIVAAGGDGTVAEIVNRTVPGVPIAVFPLGTENLLAKYLQIDHDPEVFAQLVAQGRTVWLDAGRANGRLFLLMASVGFDAEVVRRLHAERDGNISHWSYAKPILQTIRSYQYPELRIKCDTAPSGADSMAEHSETIRCRWAFVFNLPKYGGGLKFAPLANGTDGQLDMCAFQRGGLLSGLRYLAAVVLGRHRNLREFTSRQGTQLQIESDVPVPYELDGDPGGTLPLTIEVVPKRVRVLVPTHWQADGKSPA